MYVFGGRGVDGNDLGDLAAFDISSECMCRTAGTLLDVDRLTFLGSQTVAHV